MIDLRRKRADWVNHKIDIRTLENLEAEIDQASRQASRCTAGVNWSIVQYAQASAEHNAYALLHNH
jgi:hypothetical protein